ncbi:DeoR/GlpR transcriptional regulator [Robertkochia marina]|uniref:DeoR/GlpR transcriptional regulator n=1 Tax=Robertkochia marina TaxID=1227945 RepID=A0A4S3LXB1_9FLAO|nr:DeoR/GlpR family DNA-binding transcription regulator [Robertkochia marina]THD65702.1 DeoR/GlpR transcriptional regulator [Robertkochia marina]TRZ46614.1 DeoR/GlpR transcriptional regulator [Robertkochia marina]
MLKAERHQHILNEVSIRSRIQLSDIADTLGVSIDTIRRDVKELDDNKKLKKVHGGAISLGYNIFPFSNNEVFNKEKKAQIAQKAITLIKENAVILMSGGTTNLELARQLPADMDITVFTPSLPIAMQLLAHPKAEVIVIGGKVSKDAQLAIGAQVVQELGNIRADLCFLGTGYLDIEHGLTEFDYEVVQVKKAMINSSRRIVSLCISEKLNSVQRFKTCDIRDIDTLITELPPDAEVLRPYQSFNVNLL